MTDGAILRTGSGAAPPLPRRALRAQPALLAPRPSSIVGQQPGRAAHRPAAGPGPASPASCSPALTQRGRRAHRSMPWPLLSCSALSKP